MRIFSILCIVLIVNSFLFSTSAQKTKVKNEGNYITITRGKLETKIELCTPEMFRYCKAAKGDFRENETWMVQEYNWPAVSYSLKDEDDNIQITTSSLTLKLDKNTMSLSVFDKDGKLINQDTKTVSTAGEISCRKELQAGEHFFGFGERMDFIDQLGKKVELNVGRGLRRPHEIGAYNILEANYSPVPFFMSTKGYGIFFHTSYKTTWDMGNTSSDYYEFSSADSELDYYFIYGPDLLDILNSYTSLTGTTPMMPECAMGLHVGTYSGGTWGHEDLTSQYYVVALAKKFRELGIPVDILHLDSTWRNFGKENGKGGVTFEWRETGFPDPKAMFDSVYALNYNMVGLHIRPRIDDGEVKTLRLQAHEAGVTYPENGKPGDFINYFDEDAVDWWWDNGLKTIAELGCMFVKTDEGSAFGRKANESDKIGPTGYEISELHNIFPIVYAEAPYLKFQEYNNMRGMNHTREGYAGVQRYPFIFAGDWPAEWQYFLPVIRAGINISISGIGAWAHCMGGFEHIADPELYIRWCQFGMFSPIAHLFGMEHPNYKEPWSYGEEAQKIFTKYDKMRYQLMPYIYSNYYEMYKTGKPIMQALVLHYPDDPNVYPIDDQYLFGDDIMVCPVTVKGTKTRVVYLPKGEWIDYWTGKKLQGGQHILVTTPIEKLPLYIKAGAIIPTQEVVQYVGEKDIHKYTLDVYPTGKSSYNIYQDDGKSLKYQEGDYAITKVECNAGETTEITLNKAEGDYDLGKMEYELKVHVENSPENVLVGEEKIKYEFDEESHILAINISKEKGEEIKINIK